MSGRGELPGTQVFEPYVNNGGSVVALAGEEYAAIGADTRLSAGLAVHTRAQRRLFPLSARVVLGAAGCWGDVLALVRLMRARHQMYEHEHCKPMSTPAAAQMLSTVLYYKRFFPYYALSVLAGLDAEGRGCVYSYDPLGHRERCPCRASGSAGAALQPLLDSQLGLENVQGVKRPLPLEKALALIKDVFTCAAERDVQTGDSIHILVITGDGIQEEKFELRKD